MAALLQVGLSVSPVSAAEAPYEFEPTLSLTGNCSASQLDPIPDPGCPAPPHPSVPFSEPRSVAIDSFGDEYVANFAGNGEQGRIDVFDDEGFFITELVDPNGPKSVAVDSKGYLYVFEQSGASVSRVVRYTPTVYKPEEGEIEYESTTKVILTDEFVSNGGVAIDSSNDHLFVARGDRIDEFGSADEENKLLSSIEGLSWSNWVAVDAQRRRLFASSCRSGSKECGVLVFEADLPHNLIEEVDGSSLPAEKFSSAKGWLSITVDEETGHFFIDDLEVTKNIYEFGENYEFLSTLTFNSFQGGNALQIAVSNADEAFNQHYLFVPVLLGNGRVLAFRPANECPPGVEGAVASNLAETEAQLQVIIDPCGGQTHYAFEYTSQQQFEQEGFAGARIAVDGVISGQSLKRQVTTSLTGLVPGTAYRFRIVATNGRGSDEEAAQFITYSDAPVGGPPCPNEPLRSGLSGLLPDCRAYELVTPADTNGRPPRGIGFAGDAFPTLEASPSGSAVSFIAEGGLLPGTEGTGGFNGDLYRSVRGDSGWTTESAGFVGAQSNNSAPGSTSLDQGFAFLSAGGEGTAVVEGQRSAYVRYPDGHLELVGRGSLGSDPGVEGKFLTENGAHIVFQTRNRDVANGERARQLEPNAPPPVFKEENGEEVLVRGTVAVYDRTPDEVTHVVSLLPGDITPAAGADAFYKGASADGVGIAFSIGSTLYLRVDNSVTYEVGENLIFAGVADGGRRVFYVEGGDLFALDIESGGIVEMTSTGNAEVVNIAPDGSRAYFASTTAIPGSGANPNGAFAEVGKPNLYLSEDGQIRFVGTVTARDVEGELNPESGVKTDGLGLWTSTLSQPARDPSRLTPDGRVLLFQSRANLDGYDSGGDPQIYRYDSDLPQLQCISCIPTKAAADGGATLQSIAQTQIAAPPFSAFGFTPNLRADGRRAFFQSKEPLVAADTNGVQDVYEWEEQGVGGCTRPGGCTYLISSGQSSHDTYLYGISRSGDDVFFITDDVLVPGDDNTLSIYDARVNGGFAQQPAVICEGESCRPRLTPPPSLPKAARPADGARDNASRRCPRGKRKIKKHRKVRCVKKRQRHHHKKRMDKKRMAK
ncbi:MAG TPA: hypothetical protein VN732_09990 [Solirubrobacterales bacterium]|nr:hypothetical protein [Solirubrobacterales bacterium]